MANNPKDRKFPRPPLFKPTQESIKALSEAFEKAKSSKKGSKNWTMEIHNG